MKYYIWVDGEEHGPYEFEQIYDSWKDGNAAPGFLWRREDQKTFAMPETLEQEYERIHRPVAPPQQSSSDETFSPPKPFASIQRKNFRLKIGIGASLLGTLLIVAGLGFAASSGGVGGVLVSFGFVVFFFGWCDAVLRGLAEIIRQLDELNQRTDSIKH